MRKRAIAIADFKISKKAKNYVLEVLDNNRLTYGRFTSLYESLFSKIINRKFSTAVNSGTSGLIVAIHALKETYGWNDGDEIIVPAVTFIATSNAVIHNNLKPVFVDVEQDYYCLDPKKIEDKISKKTRAILPVHLFGQSAEMNAIMKIARKYKLKVIEDASEAMFAKYNNKQVGSMGDVSIFSTYVAHVIVTGIGGIVSTNDLQLSNLIKSLIFHGRDNIYLKMEDDDNLTNLLKISSIIERRFLFSHIGYSMRISEIESALGLAELQNRKKIISSRHKVGKLLTNQLGQFENYFQLPKIRKNCEHIFMLYPIIIKDERIEKEDLLFFLEKNGIETRQFMPILNQPSYIKLFGDTEDNYPIAKKLVSRGFIIGSHPLITSSDVNYLSKILSCYLKSQNLI